MNDFFSQLKNDHHDFDTKNAENVLGDNPFSVFEKWMKTAVENNISEANACVVSTVSEDLQPSSRIVYLKEVQNGKFIFFTNYHSHKGQDLAKNNKISMLFFWKELSQQVRIEGICEKVDERVSDEYFASRPKSSQIGAWASNQSEKLQSRAELEQRVYEFSEKFPNEVPRPPHWGGYAVVPKKIEFWQGRLSRLHDRIIFERVGEKWEVYRINP